MYIFCLDIYLLKKVFNPWLRQCLILLNSQGEGLLLLFIISENFKCVVIRPAQHGLNNLFFFNPYLFSKNLG